MDESLETGPYPVLPDRPGWWWWAPWTDSECPFPVYVCALPLGRVCVPEPCRTSPRGLALNGLGRTLRTMGGVWLGPVASLEPPPNGKEKP